jgi:uncharacterized OB-fold protein
MNPTIPPFPDADSGPFWDATRRHELQVQRCQLCDRLLFPARPACDLCGNGELDWVAMSGRGTVVSWVVTRQVFNKLFAASVPYTTLLVQLEEAPNLLMYGNWAAGMVDSAPGGAVDRAFVPQPGLPVEAIFEDHDEGFTLVQWSPRVADLS